MCFSVEIVRDLKFLAQEFSAKIDKSAFERLNKNNGLNPKMFKIPGEDNRIFPNIYSPILIAPKKERLIYPMRYRIRPAGSSSEVPSKFNMYNARLDSLHKRKTWKGLFAKNHGLVAFRAFFEWVKTPDGSRKLGVFTPLDRNLMWAPCLTEVWSDGKTSLDTFAIITDEPPIEVREAGHDRCPIFLRQNLINDWLSPQGKSKTELVELLGHQEPVKYSFSLV